MPGGTRVEVTSHAECPIDPSGVLELYAAEQWWPDRTRSQLVEVLETGPAVGAGIGDRLVGFARAVSDGAFRVYVEDVVVVADARHAGIGRSLVTGLLELLPTTAVPSLFCSHLLPPPTRPVSRRSRRTPSWHERASTELVSGSDLSARDR